MMAKDNHFESDVDVWPFLLQPFHPVSPADSPPIGSLYYLLHSRSELSLPGSCFLPKSRQKVGLVSKSSQPGLPIPEEEAARLGDRLPHQVAGVNRPPYLISDLQEHFLFNSSSGFCWIFIDIALHIPNMVCDTNMTCCSWKRVVDI